MPVPGVVQGGRAAAGAALQPPHTPPFLREPWREARLLLLRCPAGPPASAPHRYFQLHPRLTSPSPHPHPAADPPAHLRPHCLRRAAPAGGEAFASAAWLPLTHSRHC